MTSYARQFADWLADANQVVVFTGAGISTESGIPDFRSPGGVWATNQPVYFDDFVARADAREEYWRQKAIAHDDFWLAQPSAGHQVLAKWEQQGAVRAVITQNIDGLHQAAGSRSVLELHGTAREVMCLECSDRFDADTMVKRYRETGAPPPCPACGGITKHATVSFGQALPTDVLEAALGLAANADLFIALGSSLVVEPAASLPRVAADSGARLVLVNRDPTPLDDHANLIVRDPIGEALTNVESAREEQ